MSTYLCPPPYVHSSDSGVSDSEEGSVSRRKKKTSRDKDKSKKSKKEKSKEEEKRKGVPPFCIHCAVTTIT